MTTEITFILHTTKENHEDVLSNIERIKTLKLDVENKNEKQDIVCTALLPDDKSERTANFCSSMYQLDHVESVKMFVGTIPDEEIEQPNKLIPFIPMAISSIVTFITIYQVLISLEKNTNILDIFNFAIIPSTVIFLIQLGSMKYDYWSKIFRKKIK